MISQFLVTHFRTVWRIYERFLERCQEKNLVLNWEKCHFMVT